MILQSPCFQSSKTRMFKNIRVWSQNERILGSNQFWRSVSKGSASFCRIRIHHIFHGSGSRPRSETSSLAPLFPSAFTLNLSHLLLHPTSLTPPPSSLQPPPSSLTPHPLLPHPPPSPRAPPPSSIIPHPLLDHATTLIFPLS